MDPLAIWICHSSGEHSPRGGECQIHSTHAWSPIKASRLRAARPVTPTSITATCRVTQASSFQIWPQACGIFGYGQPKCVGREPAGVGEDRLIHCRSAQPAGGGRRVFAMPNRPRVHRGDLLRTRVNAGRRSIAGLRSGQTLATWIAPARQFDVSSTRPARAIGSQIGERHGSCS